MGLTELVIRVRAIRRLSKLANEIARRCHEPLWLHVERHAAGTNLPEVRGYTWAKASELVEAEVNELLRRERNLGDWARAELLARAREQVVERVLDDALAARWTWHVAPRRAA